MANKPIDLLQPKWEGEQNIDQIRLNRGVQGTYSRISVATQESASVSPVTIIEYVSQIDPDSIVDMLGSYIDAMTKAGFSVNSATYAGYPISDDVNKIVKAYFVGRKMNSTDQIVHYFTFYPGSENYEAVKRKVYGFSTDNVVKF